MSTTNAIARPTGLDLRLARVARGVTQTELARTLGCSRQRISLVEGSIRPTVRWVDVYVGGLRKLDAHE